MPSSGGTPRGGGKGDEPWTGAAAGKGAPRWRDLALAGLGIALCSAWGLIHLADLKPASLHPALSDTWQDSTLSIAYPKGWNLTVYTSGDGRQVALNLEAGGHVAMSIRSQTWEVVPAEAADSALAELLGTLGAVERSRRPLERWGGYGGSGTEVDMRSAQGRDLGLAVFAHSGAGRSFLAIEMVDEGWRESLRPGMDLVRRTLRLKGRPTLPPNTASAGGSVDSLVTQALRDFLEGADRAPAPGPRPAGHAAQPGEAPAGF